MKLGNDVLIEIVSIVQNALLTLSDASEDLRELDLSVEDDLIVLSEEYLESDGRFNSLEESDDD